MHRKESKTEYVYEVRRSSVKDEPEMASEVIGHPVVDMVTERESVYVRLVKREVTK